MASQLASAVESMTIMPSRVSIAECCCCCQQSSPSLSSPGDSWRTPSDRLTSEALRRLDGKLLLAPKSFRSALDEFAIAARCQISLPERLRGGTPLRGYVMRGRAGAAVSSESVGAGYARSLHADSLPRLLSLTSRTTAAIGLDRPRELRKRATESICRDTVSTALICRSASPRSSRGVDDLVGVDRKMSLDDDGSRASLDARTLRFAATSL